ncbi:hypothetical protein [Gimesia fumaroli]|uniref:Uncharacterized protein n=1 Tax=Gimesia fumaroli TaxID=2527976 RepID=A0A518I5V6_9PLAN|nr:hypothetical protein [Gimesia fumaroli]QDV48438.1 hypothetical protein Enr17x_04500 [Gimesia fumaroli]
MSLKDKLMQRLDPEGLKSKNFGCCTGATMPSRRLTATLIDVSSGGCECLDGISFSLNFAGHSSWFGEYESDVCGTQKIAAGLICLRDQTGFHWRGGVICGDGHFIGIEDLDSCDPFLLEFPALPLRKSQCCSESQHLILTITA